MSNFELWNSYMKCYDFLSSMRGYVQSLCDVAEAVVAGGAPSPLRVLDAGSGTGNLSMLLKSRGCDVVSCDFSPVALASHRAKDPDAVLIETSLEKPLPFDDRSFNAVCCASVLFTLSRAGCHLALREFFRVLRPGGLVVVTVGTSNADLKKLLKLYVSSLIREHGPATGSYYALKRMPALLRVAYYTRKLRSLKDWQGFHAFTADELRVLFEAAGFEQGNVTQTYGGCFLLGVAAKRVGNPVQYEQALAAT
jgi:ubiquinone/menaquinone biosynthesis C-methylase UbiE